tara:strand:- start:1216 stop:2169 length:954 start_codon:yes stop_codon:yes gene_type:complete
MNNVGLLYRNLIIFLVSLVLLNLSIGFYKSFSEKKKVKIASLDYMIRSNESVYDFSTDSKVDFISESKEMIDIFKKYNFSSENFLSDESDNLIIFSSLPNDFMEVEPVSERKKLFVNTLLPIIYVENQKILEDRKKILDWWSQSNGEDFSREFWPSWLFELSEKYDSGNSNVGNLLIKVDIVPTSVALAQAAIESGWGTSRYLREGNAIYGQYTFDKKKGISPKKIPKGKNFYIKKFSNLSESTRSYLKNINTHRAYEKFRQERKKLRMNGEILSGKVLSSYLESYSERRKAYVDDVRNLIESNNFMKFDYSNNLPN